MLEQSETNMFGKDGTLGFVRQIFPLIDDLKLKIEVDRRIVKILQRVAILLAEGDEVGGHDNMYLLLLILIDPKGAVQTQHIFLNVTDDIRMDGQENGTFLVGEVILHLVGYCKEVLYLESF